MQELSWHRNRRFAPLRHAYLRYPFLTPSQRRLSGERKHRFGDQLNGGSGQLPNRLLFSAGVDCGITRWMTAKQVGVFEWKDHRKGYIYALVQDGAAGIKLKPFPSRNLIVTGNALIRLNNAGLRSAVVPLVGGSYTF